VFANLGKAKADPAPESLAEIFDLLDRKATHLELRAAQREAIQEINLQLKERDVILKASTGSGKTVVGLVYAEYMRRRCPGELVIYLCPTTQLIGQVIEAAGNIGVQAETFGGDRFPTNALRGKSILVCSYDKLFTARNIFNTDGIVPAAIIMDDVHAGLDRVRSKYTINIAGDAYQKIIGIFSPLCSPLEPAVWHGIHNSEYDAQYEVPFWIWASQCNNVFSIIDALKNERDYAFQWANVSRYIEFSRLCISGSYAELSLPVLPLEEHHAYSSAKHRLFMSASIKDGSSLIRELNCDPEALKRVVEPPSDKGAGERMIIPVALVDSGIDREKIAELCRGALSAANVVVLASSSRQSELWVQYGARMCLGDDVEVAVAKLRGSKAGNFFVFAQRFDGIDLPDDACRILIIDGVPVGERICDQIDANRQKNTAFYNLRATTKFEQALGRAVRSSADYAVVLLVGSDIASFVGRKDVESLLDASAREQISLGLALSDNLRVGKDSLSSLSDAIKALLERSAEWKEAYRERMQSVAREVRAAGQLTHDEVAASIERQAWNSAKSRNFQAAVGLMQRAVEVESLEKLQKAELSLRMAAYLNKFDPAKSLSVYRYAFGLNSSLPRPAELPERKYVIAGQQASRLRETLGEYSSALAVVATLEEVKAKLAFANRYDVVEAALRDLGRMIGADSSMPEKEVGRGPDVLWVFDEVAFCIEAKNEKTRPIFKADAGQLLNSLQWCESQLGTEIELVPVFVTDIPAAERLEDVSFGPRFMTEQVAFEIVDKLRQIVMGLSYEGPLFNDVAAINRQLGEAQLTGKGLRGGLRDIQKG
jgi:hypothetical protein